MTHFRKWLPAGLAILATALVLLAAASAKAAPQPPTIPDPSAGGPQYLYYLYARLSPERPWVVVGSEPTYAAAQADADRLRPFGYDVYVRKGVAVPLPALAGPTQPPVVGPAIGPPLK